jgi:hypothetical protein
MEIPPSAAAAIWRIRLPLHRSIKSIILYVLLTNFIKTVLLWETYLYVHFTYKASRWISIKFDTGRQGMLSVPVNKTSNSNLNFEATSVLNMQGQSHRLLDFFFFATSNKRKNINQCVPQWKLTFSSLVYCQTARLATLGCSEHHSVTSWAYRNNGLKYTPISFSLR